MFEEGCGRRGKDTSSCLFWLGRRRLGLSRTQGVFGGDWRLFALDSGSM